MNDESQRGAHVEGVPEGVPGGLDKAPSSIPGHFIRDDLPLPSRQFTAHGLIDEGEDA